MFDAENKPDYSPTNLDKEKMSNLEVGDMMTAECGFWRVLKYKTDFVLILVSRKHNIFKEFKELKDIIVYLRNL